MTKILDLENPKMNELIDRLADAVLTKIESKTSEKLEHNDWEFSKNDEKTIEKPRKRTKNGLLDFSEMALDKNRSEEERHSSLWRQSCAEWIQHFKRLDQPILIWYSKRKDPQDWTCYPREVKSERVEVTKIGGRIEERTFFYHLIYGLEIPPEKYRTKAKERMAEIWKVSDTDTKEFIDFYKEAQGKNYTPPKEKKESARIGMVYEQQLEYHFNLNGYHVQLHGLKKKTGDEGVDHILYKNGKTSLVQAKAYRKGKRIKASELDIMFNNMNDFYSKHKFNDKLIIGELEDIILAVPSEDVLSGAAKLKAEELGMHVEIVPIRKDWPKYKCVISSREKKFYGPNDSAYYKTNMLSDKRRFWADSIEEAQGKNYKGSGK